MNKKIVLMAVACGLFGKILGMEPSKEKIGKQSEVDLNAAIIEAAKAANFERVCELHKQGAAIDARDREGNTPLHFAAFRDSEPIARFLLDNNASIHAQGGKDRIPLHIAALAGAVHVGSLLLDQDGAEVDCRDADGITPLHMAASQNKIELVRSLIEYKAQVDAQGSDAMSALHYAVGSEGLVKLLVEGNATVDILNGNNASPLHRAAQHGSPETLRYLIGKGAAVNRQEVDGFAPLVFAMLAGKLENVKTLLELGADATITDRFGLTPLTKLQTITAIKIENKKKIEKLLKKAIKNKKK